MNGYCSEHFRVRLTTRSLSTPALHEVALWDQVRGQLYASDLLTSPSSSDAMSYDNGANLENEERPLRVLIIGAGIGGLVCTPCLRFIPEKDRWADA